MQLVVDRRKLLVGRLQFLFGCLELFVGRLQLLVGALKLLIGALQLLVGGLHFFDGRLQVFFGRRELAFEFDHGQVRFGSFAHRARRFDRRRGRAGFVEEFVEEDDEALSSSCILKWHDVERNGAWTVFAPKRDRWRRDGQAVSKGLMRRRSQGREHFRLG